MFFRKQQNTTPPASERSSSPAVGGAHQLSIVSDNSRSDARFGDSTAGSAEHHVGLVLDAVGAVLAALSRYPIDLPDRPGEELARELGQWRRHITLGTALEEDSERAAVGISERDWDGMVRVVTEQRREEHQYVAASFNELREAIWACVETVHSVLQVDHGTTVTTDTELTRAKNALQRLQGGSLKQEVLGAILAIETALEARREQQQKQFAELASRIDRLDRQLEEARRESTTDALTGLGNRKLFDVMLKRAVQMHSLDRQPVVLLVMDLDKLKLVNDMYGHQAGDQAIKTLASALGRVFLRQSDVLCRFGGDEFGVILHNTDWKMAATLGKRLQEQISAMPSPHPAMEFSLGVSVGVAQFESHESEIEWMARADQALYKAKQNGRERVCVADDKLRKSA